MRLTRSADTRGVKTKARTLSSASVPKPGGEDTEDGREEAKEGVLMWLLKLEALMS